MPQRELNVLTRATRGRACSITRRSMNARHRDATASHEYDSWMSRSARSTLAAVNAWSTVPSAKARSRSPSASWSGSAHSDPATETWVSDWLQAERHRLDRRVGAEVGEARVGDRDHRHPGQHRLGHGQPEAFAAGRDGRSTRRRCRASGSPRSGRSRSIQRTSGGSGWSSPSRSSSNPTTLCGFGNDFTTSVTSSAPVNRSK